MEDKIEVGDYVRTKYGIAKVEKVEPDKPHKTIWYTVDKPQYYCFLVREQEVIKSSKNIIDLIEVGDYVNGDKVEAVDYAEDKQGNYIDVLGTMEIDDDFAYPIILRNENIKSIVTKEQYKQIEYIVKE